MTREELTQGLLAVRAMMDAGSLKNNPDYELAGEVWGIRVGRETHHFRFYPAGDFVAPLYVDIHGGGMCWGSMEDTDPLARMLNQQLGMHVLSPDYPLSPEHACPAQREYVYGTLREVLSHAEEWKVDPSRVIVGGCSAGANLATVMTMMAAERKEFSFAGQVLDHPWLDLDHRIGWENRVSGGAAFTQESMEALAAAYADEDQRKEPLCTPLNAVKALLRKLPPAIIQTCGKDPLRPEGDQYAEMLREAGVPVSWHCFPGAEHGFSQQISEIGQSGRQWIIDRIREMKWLESRK